jgi:hypothetical protein
MTGVGATIRRGLSRKGCFRAEVRPQAGDGMHTMPHHSVGELHMVDADAETIRIRASSSAVSSAV